MKLIFKNRGSRIWFIVTAVLTVLFLAVNVVATAVFYDLLGQVLPGGGERAVYADGVEPIYLTEYTDKDDVRAAAQKFNLQLAREGIVLMKNEGNALPIYTPQSPEGKKASAKPKVSVFGKNSASIAYGGSGSGGFASDASVTLYDALEGAGYELNPSLKSFYASNSSGTGRTKNPSLVPGGSAEAPTLYTGETPWSDYSDTIKGSFDGYKDAAFVVFTRIGGEGWDLPRASSSDVANNPGDHFLQLDKNELALLDAVIAENFKKVVVILNSGSAMQLDFLKDSKYAGGIDAVVWMGFPGENGTIALGEVLNGTTNPSGRTPDTYAADFKKDPTWVNFGEYRYQLPSGQSGSYYYVHYEEDVYMGYKYYETRAATYNGPVAALSEKDYANGEEWYDDHVIYPFGHGLSYASFTWEIADKSTIENQTITKGQKYTVKVKVTNNGTVAGKEVVQLYGNAPYNAAGQGYTTNGIEKPYVTLLDFAKTDMIQPNGGVGYVDLTFDPYYLASYDCYDKNGNTFKGFELDAGDGYNLFISKNAHDVKFTIPFKSPNIQYPTDLVSGGEVKNRYTGQSNSYFNSDLKLSGLLSRSNWAEWPTAPDNSDHTVDLAFTNALKDTNHNNPTRFGDIEMPRTGQNNNLILRDLLFDANGEPYQKKDGFPYIDYNDSKWEDLLDQAVFSQMNDLYERAAYQTKKVESIGLPRTNCGDGPVGWANFMNPDTAAIYDTFAYVAQVVVAATFNQELVEDFGRMVGDEGLIGNFRGDKMPYSGWYAPGVNIHRSPFGGRNFEYYSEDGVLSGKMAAAQIRGAQSKGVFCFIKHFALNEQETQRSLNGSCSWVTEQAMREIYLRPFEIAVKEGGSRAVMSSFNRIGTRWTGGDYRLLTNILRDEWGFKGTVICDFNDGTPYMITRQMAYAGGDLNLATRGSSWCNSSSDADMYILRQCVKNVAYTVGNSNAMNGEIIGYKLPLWTIFLIVFDCVLVAGLGVWGFFAIRKALKLQKENQTQAQENQVEV